MLDTIIIDDEIFADIKDDVENLLFDADFPWYLMLRVPLNMGWGRAPHEGVPKIGAQAPAHNGCGSLGPPL